MLCRLTILVQSKAPMTSPLARTMLIRLRPTILTRGKSRSMPDRTRFNATSWQRWCLAFDRLHTRQVVLSLAALGLTPLTGLAADKTALDLNDKQRLPGELPPVLSPDIAQALSESPLVYLLPLHHNGNPSRCQAEIWFVMVQEALLVCTDSKSWRARAAATGRQQTRIWVGDVGVWETGFDRHLSCPVCAPRRV